MTPFLRPCPFCHSSNMARQGKQLHVNENCIALDINGEVNGYCVECQSCHAAGPTRDTEGEACEGWNHPARWCDDCESFTDDLAPIRDPWGEIHGWKCEPCQDGVDGGYYNQGAATAAELRDQMDRIQRELKR